jgi:HlyD family secretion protein
MRSVFIYIVAVSFLFVGCKHSTTIHPERKNIVETVYASGKILADSEYTVYALNAGNVIKKQVKEGDIVKRNQVLYVINNTAPAAKLDASKEAYDNALQNVSSNSRIINDLKLTLQNASIKLSQDSLQYIRLRNLWADNIGTKSSLDMAEAQYKTSINQKKSAKEKYASTVNELHLALKNAKSQLAGAQTELNNFIIRADRAGTVYQVLKENGEAVKAGEPLVLMGNSTTRLIKLNVDQQDIYRIKPGQEVLLKTDLSGDKIFKAKIIRTYPLMNEADQTFRVDAAFADNEKQPFIHSSVEANIITQRKQNCLVVPRQVLVNGDSIMVKQDGKARTIAVITGIHTLDEVEILSGLNDNTTIIVPVKK